MANEDYILKLKAEFEDKLTEKLEPLQNRLKELEKEAKKPKKVKVTALDKATKVIETVKGKIRALQRLRAEVKLKAQSGEAQSKIDTLKQGMSILAEGVDIRAKLIDLASKGLSKIWDLTKKLAKGVVIGVGLAGARAVKTGVEGLANEQKNKVTINRVFENSGMTKGKARVQGSSYYKDLEAFSMKTPFTPDQMAFFGTKARQIAKGDRNKSFDTAKMMANVSAFRSDRTPDEIAEAFFSASVGNMEMLNNLLGTHYANWQEAVKGIEKDYGGMVEELSKTLPGAWSTFVGIVQSSCKEMMKPFGEARSSAMAHVSEKMLGLRDYIAENGRQFAHFGQDIKDAFQPVLTVLDGVFERLQSPEGLKMMDGMLNGISEFVAGVSEGLGGAIQMISATMESINPERFAGFGQRAGFTIGIILQGIALVISGMLQIRAFIGDIVAKWNWLCTTITSKWNQAINYVKTWWRNFKAQWSSDVHSIKTAWNNACAWISNKFRAVCEKIKGWWQGVKDFLSHPIQTVVNGLGGLGFASGKNRVPYDNYPARLHEGERVLSRREADLYDKQQKKGSARLTSDSMARTSNNNINISKLADQIIVREEADIDKITDRLVRNIKLQLA